MINANVENTGKYAVAGGNIEIIHLCEQNHSSFDDAYETAIEFHRNDIFKYIYENKINTIKKLEELGEKCVSYFNYEILSFLIEAGMKINDSIVNESAKNRNMFLTKYFFHEYQIPKTTLIFSIKSGNIELVKYIFRQKGIVVDALKIILEIIQTILTSSTNLTKIAYYFIEKGII